MDRGQGRSVWWSQESTQRTQQERRLDQRQREFALLQLIGMDTVPGARQCGCFRELLIKTEHGVHVLFGVVIEAIHGSSSVQWPPVGFRECGNFHLPGVSLRRGATDGPATWRCRWRWERLGSIL